MIHGGRHSPHPILLIGLLAFLPELAFAQAPDSAARVDSIFAAWNNRQSPGCAVAVARDGRTIIERAYGMADLERDVAGTPATIFEAGSVSKQFTAAAIHLLAQQGRLSLDDDIRRHLPELPDYGTPVTIRHMLNHTSGLRDWGAVAAIGGWPRGTRAYTQAHTLDITARQRALNFRPGSEYLYSNSNFNLLAIVVARLSGMSFGEFTRRHLFEPLGMRHTSWRDDYQRIVPGRAVGYSRGRTGWGIDHPAENAHGNGGLLTTVGDLLMWNEALTGGRIGSPALTPELERQGVLANGRRITYASGLFVGDYRGLREVWHDGATAGYRAHLSRYPDQRLSVALLCNAGNANSSQLGHRVAEVFLTGLTAPPSPPAASHTATAAELEAVAGMYRNERNMQPVRFVVRDGSLSLEGGQALVPVAGTVFRLGSALQFVFEPRPGGRPGIRVTSVAGDTLTAEPVEPASPTAQDLAAYAGTYWSEEADVAVTLAVGDSSRLELRYRVGEPVRLTPAYRDAFTSPRGLVLFSRDGAGQVDGFGVWVERARNVRFERR